MLPPSCRNQGGGKTAPMALTDRVEPQFGWQNQAEHLALTHMPMGIAAMTLAKKARGGAICTSHLSSASGADRAIRTRSDPPHIHCDNEFAQVNARVLQTQLARQKLAAREMRRAYRDAIRSGRNDAENVTADLEDELNVAREEILLQQNDKHALKASLDLLVSENARLSQRLAERNTTLEQARDGLERGKAALDAAQTAHNSLNAAVDEANRKQQTAGNKLDAVKLRMQKFDGRAQCLASKISDRKQQSQSCENRAQQAACCA